MTPEPTPAHRTSHGRRWAAAGGLLLLVGAATGTLLMVVPVVIVVLGVRWARRNAHTSASDRLVATERQMAPALVALGYVESVPDTAVVVPEHAFAGVLARPSRQIRRRFETPGAERHLEIASVIAVDPATRMRDKAAVTVAHNLGGPQDVGAATALLEAWTTVPSVTLPASTRFGLVDGWLVAAFDPFRTRDPGAVAAAVAAALTSIAEDAATH